MNVSEEPKNISALNIFTFIKEIYQSIKSIHKRLDNISEEQKNISSNLDRINTNHNLLFQKNYELLMNIQCKLDSRESINDSIRDRKSVV